MFARGVWQQRGILAGEQCSPLRRTTKPPLCKGRCPAGAEGLWPYEGSSMYGQGHNPSVCAIAQPAPFAQGGHPSTPIEFLLAPEGPDGERAKSVKKNAALLHFLAFGSFDHRLGVLRGEQPLRRASRAIGSSGTLFASFWGSKRKDYWKYPIKKSGAPQGGAQR